jgi:4-methylaminobutanoate oxidase (formaldehyde-forming)
MCNDDIGLNSIGILTGGGIGRVLAHWIVNGQPDVDVCGFNIDRLQRYQANPDYREARVTESLGNVYKCHYPYKVPQTARGAKRTALFDRVAKQGAYFRAVSGFETADFYETDIVNDPQDGRGLRNSGSSINQGRSSKHLEYSWGRPSFWKYWEAEHKACREGVCLIDMSFMSKFLVQGRDAGPALNRLEFFLIIGNLFLMSFNV